MRDWLQKVLQKSNNWKGFFGSRSFSVQEERFDGSTETDDDGFVVSRIFSLQDVPKHLGHSVAAAYVGTQKEEYGRERWSQ